MPIKVQCVRVSTSITPCTYLLVIQCPGQTALRITDKSHLLKLPSYKYI